VALRDRYDSDGLLAVGPERHRIDERVVCEPWPATLVEIGVTIGSSSEHRRSLFDHLVGFLAWFDRALKSDDRREVWIRGRFASTLAPEVEELDLVVHYSGLAVGPGDRWVLSALAAHPIQLPPHRLVVTPLRHDDVEYTFARDQEAVRSRVRTLRPETKEQVVAGWIRVLGEEGHG
jgi:hypothetical protein